MRSLIQDVSVESAKALIGQGKKGLEIQEKNDSVVGAVEYIHSLEENFRVGRLHRWFYEVPPSEVLPSPVQRPRPPILMGRWVPASLNRAGRSADGRISNSATDLTRIDEAIALVHEGAEDARKDPATVEIVVRGMVQMTAAKGARPSAAYRVGGSDPL